ncbi:helix-turn-helix domain-containing protein [Glutamicibacter sp. Je.9.36]|uniref:helix-turn-helix domain-containing protein n=1 Tax=Glutamicibacter sp. Je.9.36 TaxID=3142837 RepID=UPI003DA925FB
MNIPEHRRAFGDRVRALRKAKGFTSQEAFANHLELDRTYVSGIERGRRNPTLDIIVKIANGLGEHPSALLSTIE